MCGAERENLLRTVDRPDTSADAAGQGAADACDERFVAPLALRGIEVDQLHLRKAGAARDPLVDGIGCEREFLALHQLDDAAA